MISTIRILKKPSQYWDAVTILKDGKVICNVNMFYEVTPEWIYVYETSGGSGIGWFKGELKRKIFIGDCELITETA